METLNKIAAEIYLSGRPFEDVLTELVAAEKAKYQDVALKAVQDGMCTADVRGNLIARGVTPSVATNLAFEAEDKHIRLKSRAEQLAKATATAQTLFKNGVSFAEVQNTLRRDGIPADVAAQVCGENYSTHFRS